MRGYHAEILYSDIIRIIIILLYGDIMLGYYAGIFMRRYYTGMLYGDIIRGYYTGLLLCRDIIMRGYYMGILLCGDIIIQGYYCTGILL